MTTVLVTGVGAIMGYGVLRSLRAFDKSIRLIGADIYPNAVGQKWSDSFVVAPLTSAVEYLDWLRSAIIKNNVDLIIPCIEQDVKFYSANRELFRALKVSVALNDENLIDLSDDKWLMHEEIIKVNKAYAIPSSLDTNFDRLSNLYGLPFLLKPRKGYASKGIERIHNVDELSKFADKIGTDLMVQEIVGSDDEEYTVAVFGDGLGNISASITFRRELANDGSTAKAWVQQHDSLDAVVRDICSYFKPIGPTNLQFRRVPSGWKLLEINPRISSTTSIRTAFGYNEAKMCLDYYIKGRKIIQPEISFGFAARYIEDCIVHDCDNF
jgi:carbamoyl-phosphate synthase large subunit